MKICLINNCFPVYSTGSIVNSIYQSPKAENMQIFVAYAWDQKNAENHEEGIYRYGVLADKYVSALLTRLTGNYLGCAFLSTFRLINILKKIKPDVVNIHCANCYSTNHYILLKWCKKVGIKVVITEHAEYYHTGNCSFSYDCEKWKNGCGGCPELYRAVKSRFLDCTAIHWKKMQKAFSSWGKNLVITSVSPWLLKRAKQSPITNQNKTVCIENGVDTDVFYHRPEDDSFRYTKIFDEKTILFVAPKYLTGVKGGEALLELARRMPECHFVVVGVSGAKNSPDNIHYLGYTASREELAKLYSLAKITLLTSKTETFSLVTAESLCCGTPVVGFQCGGAESIAIREYSEFVKQGDVALLEGAIRKWLGAKIDKTEVSTLARSRYGYARMVKEYLDLYNELACNS